MNRVKIDDNNYTYVCPHCRYQLPMANDDTQKSVSNDETADSVNDDNNT